MSHFSEELKNFYNREGNKIIFKNGMTLNKLALAIWEDMGCTGGMEASVMSRVLKGERLFTNGQLSSFCKISQGLKYPSFNMNSFFKTFSPA